MGWRLITIVAVAAILAGGCADAAPSPPTIEARSAEVTTTATPTESGADDEDPAISLGEATAPTERSFLLPGKEQWVIVDYYSPDEGRSASRSHPGTWVWRVDGKLVILLAGNNVAIGSGPSPESAPIDVTANRALMGWKADGESVGLIAFGADGDFLRDLAVRLEREADRWSLPGATSIVDEPVSSASRSHREQTDFAPVSPDGSADLGIRVVGTTELASPGSLYRDLFSWSSLGSTSEITVAGRPAVLVSGQGAIGGSWAAVEIDGKIFSWSTTFTGGANDDQLVNLLESLVEVAEGDWRAAIDARDTEVLNAVDNEGIDPGDVPAPVDLARFLLPAGWTLESVTDKGIWTPEQRAAEIAYSEARRPAELDSQWPVSSRTQAFGFAATEGAAIGLVPVITINTAVFDGGSGVPEQPTNHTPIEVAGLVGSAFQGSAELYGENVGVFMRGSTLDDDDLIDFVESLSARGGDPGQGFVVDDDRYVLLFETTGSERPGESIRRPISKWAAWWSHDSSSAEAGITLRQISLTDLQQRLMRNHLGGATERGISGTAEDAFITGESSLARGSFLWRYDTAAELLVEVSLHRSTAITARGVFESLVPIDIESWTELATPLNVDPVNPR